MRLRRSDLTGPGLRRQRRGKGWRFTDAEGRAVDPEARQRIQDLVIPPAWRNVWICPWPNGHIQAVGTDDAGRRQYLYHEQWRRERDEEKHDRVLQLVGKLPEFRAAVGADLAGKGLGCQRVLGGALRMLDRGVFRTGGEEYAEENGTRGVATLLRDDVIVKGDDLLFCFTAKGGIERRLRMRDPDLVRLVQALRRARHGAERLLVFRDGRTWREVHADSINERFKELAGAEFTAKDLRTWNATVVAAVAFAEAQQQTSQRGRKRIEVRVMDQVAEQLGNTRTVARRSYVDPRVVRAFDEGRTIERALRKAGSADLHGDEARATIERAVYRLLTT
jgi:DNA topoisomerase-1